MTSVVRFVEERCKKTKAPRGDELSVLWAAYLEWMVEMAGAVTDRAESRAHFSEALRQLGWEEYAGSGGRARFRGLFLLRGQDSSRPGSAGRGPTDGSSSALEPIIQTELAALTAQLVETQRRLERARKDYAATREALTATRRHLALAAPGQLELLELLVGRVERADLNSVAREARGCLDSESARST